MDDKSLERLGELERLEARWQEANSVFKCRSCRAELGRVDWEAAAAGNNFNSAPPTNLRTRKAIPLAGYGERTWPIEQIAADPETIKRPYTDRTSAPLLIDIRKGVKCHNCGAETRLEALASPFRYASELARLRRKRYAMQNACNETTGHVP